MSLFTYQMETLGLLYILKEENNMGDIFVHLFNPSLPNESRPAASWCYCVQTTYLFVSVAAAYYS